MSDSVRRLIKQRLDEMELDMADVSKRIKRNHAYLQQFLKRGVPRTLPEAQRGLLAPILGVREDELRTPTTSNGEAPPSTVRPGPTTPRLPPRNQDNKDVPVWGTAEGGPNGSFEVYYGGNPVDWVRRLAGIENARDVYALYVVGLSMAPAYRPGDLIYVNPSKPPAIGSDVIIQMKPHKEGDEPRCYLKRLVRRTAEKVICEQFSPAGEVSYAVNLIIALHRVMTMAELAGA